MAGLPVVLLETRQLRTTSKAMPVKTDRNDARAMAQVVRTSCYKAVHVCCRRRGEPFLNKNRFFCAAQYILSTTQFRVYSNCKGYSRL
jgi:hypothetical protein